MRSKCTRCDSKGHTLNLHNISTFTSRSHNIGIELSRRLHKENSTVGEMCIGTVREGTGLVNLPKKKKPIRKMIDIGSLVLETAK